MTTEVVPALPDHSELRALYDAAIAEINASRNSNLLTANFYRKTSDAVFDTGCVALSDAITNTRMMHTVSAPPGGGKTTFAHALAVALTRYTENRSEALPYGVVFVVDEIKKADDFYNELTKYLSGKVAVWTTEHDVSCKEWPKLGKEPLAKFERKDLPNFPVAVVTHNFYLRSNGHHARSIVRNGVDGLRMLTIVDERPEEIPTIQIVLSTAQKVREALLKEHPETKEHLDALLQLMEKHNYKEANKIYIPDAAAIAKALGWFRTNAAMQLANRADDIPNIKELFAYGSALAAGRGWIATDGVLPCYFGYDDQRIINLTTGVVLLDATADLDGIANIDPYRMIQTEVSKASYENLEIIHVGQHTKTRLDQYLATAPNQHAYVDWMVTAITEHTHPGEKVLVICKKSLLDNQRVPNWPERDPRFDNKKSFTEEWGWDVEGRKVCVAHWGTGVGNNTWQDADAVCLFDDFFAPRWVSIARTQGYQGQKVHQGALGSMSSLKSKASSVDMIADGHILRWFKQMALRGNARHYDENGVCGKQRLVVAGNLKRFLLHVDKMFPGTPEPKIVGDVRDNTTVSNRILELLSKTVERAVTAKEIQTLIGKPWRQVSSDVITPFFDKRVRALGWQYRPVTGKVGKGKLGTRFERIVPDPHEGVLSAYM
jgi:hypothetical protein